MSDLSFTGGCFCGAVRFRVTPPAQFCAHCHCTMCRRSHGAVYVTWVAVPIAQFELLTGDDRLVHFHSSDHGTRSFCGTCGSSLFCKSTHHPEQIDVVLANFDIGADHPAPQAHIYFDDRADWVRVGDDLPRLGGPSGLEPIS
jgi:hypothetical protein